MKKNQGLPQGQLIKYTKKGVTFPFRRCHAFFYRVKCDIMDINNALLKGIPI